MFNLTDEAKIEDNLRVQVLINQIIQDIQLLHNLNPAAMSAASSIIPQRYLDGPKIAEK